MNSAQIGLAHIEDQKLFLLNQISLIVRNSLLRTHGVTWHKHQQDFVQPTPKELKIIRDGWFRKGDPKAGIRLEKRLCQSLIATDDGVCRAVRENKGRVVEYDRKDSHNFFNPQDRFTDCGRYHPPTIVEVGDARLRDWSFRPIVQTGRSPKINKASSNKYLTITTSGRGPLLATWVEGI